MDPITYGTVCSGIETPSVAWEGLGWSPTFFSEIEAFPRQVLHQRQRAVDAARTGAAQLGVPLWGDFTAMRMRFFRRLGIRLPDVLCGGTPCQAFSLAGLRQSLDDARGNLTLEYVRLANAIDNERRRLGRGGIVIGWENVPGVLSTEDNAFGCFLAGLVGADAPLVPPRSIRRWRRSKDDGEFFAWTDAGLVAGPRRVAAWRVLDSQYFDLAQRRERVFVVCCPLDGPDPAEILLECESVRRDSPPSREAGADIAGTLGGVPPGGGWRFGADEAAANQLVSAPLTAALGRRNGAPDNGDTAGHLIAFGGNNTSGPIDVATTLNASHTSSGRQDFETETFIAQVAPTLDSSYGRLYGQDHQHANAGYGLFVSTTLRARPGAKGVDSDATDTLIPTTVGTMAVNGDARSGLKLDVGLVPVSFRTAGDGAAYEEGDVTAPLTTGTDQGAQVVALTPGDRGISVDQACGGMALPQPSGVRRLMPVECERLQGFPDDYTAIQVRGEIAADSPRYKALGNSMSVPVMEWIGRRIDRAIRAHRMGRAA